MGAADRAGASPSGCWPPLAPDQIALALTAADDGRRPPPARATRAVELRVERARYDAARAERAFHQCDPDNRLVARSLESRWEAKLRDLTDAEAELARQSRAARAAGARRHRSARRATSRACGPPRRPRTATASGCCAP